MVVNMEEAREARALLVRAVEEKGADYVYAPPGWVHAYHESEDWLIVVEYGSHEALSDCVYAAPRGPDDETLVPCCIVGHAMYYMGGMDALVKAHQHEGDNAATVVPWVDEIVDCALVEAQRTQDAGLSWGKALKAFDEHIAEAVGNPKWMEET